MELNSKARRSILRKARTYFENKDRQRRERLRMLEHLRAARAGARLKRSVTNWGGLWFEKRYLTRKRCRICLWPNQRENVPLHIKRWWCPKCRIWNEYPTKKSTPRPTRRNDKEKRHQSKPMGRR